MVFDIVLFDIYAILTDAMETPHPEIQQRSDQWRRDTERDPEQEGVKGKNKNSECKSSQGGFRNRSLVKTWFQTMEVCTLLATVDTKYDSKTKLKRFQRLSKVKKNFRQKVSKTGLHWRASDAEAIRFQFRSQKQKSGRGLVLLIGFWPKLGSLATINRLPKCNASPPVIVCGMPPFSGNVGLVKVGEKMPGMVR